jgi:CTP-dependent riboflavin kinase
MLVGVVRTGKGWASGDMGQWRVLPWTPHPGTLNVEVGEEAVAEFMARVSTWSPYKGHDHPYRMGILAGVEVAVTDSGIEPAQVEVVAPVRLRDLPLEDGDTVTILLRDEGE